MKKLFIVLIVLTGSIMSALVSEENLKGKFAVGYSNGPTVRYWFSEKMKIGVEGKFDFDWGKSSYSTCDYKTDSYSTDISGVYNFKKTKIVNFNILAVAGYSYNKYFYPYISAGLSKENYPEDNCKTYSFGIGPEFEVFLPAIPNLSLSSNIILNYNYDVNKIIRPSGTTKNISENIDFSGNGFTMLGLGIRYYFN